MIIKYPVAIFIAIAFRRNLLCHLLRNAQQILVRGIEDFILQVIDVEPQRIFDIHQRHLRLYKPGIDTGDRAGRHNADQQPALKNLREAPAGNTPPLFLAEAGNEFHCHEHANTTAHSQRQKKGLRHHICL